MFIKEIALTNVTKINPKETEYSSSIFGPFGMIWWICSNHNDGTDDIKASEIIVSLC